MGTNSDAEVKNDESGCVPRATLRWPKVATDYHGALVRLVSMRAEKNWYLVFGYVELFPRDVPLPTSFAAGNAPWKLPGSSGKVALAMSATAMPVADALAWYEKAARGQIDTPWEGPPINLAAPSFGIEPALGRFCIDEEVPFAAPWHSRPRLHRLVPLRDPEETVLQLRSSEPARAWLSTNVGFDPLDFEEWLGSVSLLAPDPLLTGVGYLREGVGNDGGERIRLQAHRRRYEGYPEEEANSLMLTELQRRPAGWSDVSPSSFDEDGFSAVDYREPVSEHGYAITCPVRGLLRIVPPSHFIGQIVVNFDIVNAQLKVEVPPGGRRKPTSHYTTTRTVGAGMVQVGEALPPSGAIRIVELQEQRKRRIQAESAPQKLFGATDGGNEAPTDDELAAKRAGAELYVAGLVAAAQRRVIFVDPDFGTREMRNYALRAMRENVNVKILTSARQLRGQVDSGGCVGKASSGTQNISASSIERERLYLANIKDLRSKLGPNAPEVFVMPSSNTPLFHDRFLVVDDVVWASGPSFNELGVRIGLICRVHEPSAVIAAIEAVLMSNRTLALAEWIAQFEIRNPDVGGANAPEA